MGVNCYCPQIAYTITIPVTIPLLIAGKGENRLVEFLHQFLIDIERAYLF